MHVLCIFLIQFVKKTKEMYVATFYNTHSYLEYSVYYEIIGKTQKGTFDIGKEFSIKLNVLSELNSFWFRNYFEEN